MGQFRLSSVSRRELRLIKTQPIGYCVCKRCEVEVEISIFLRLIPRRPRPFRLPFFS